MDISTIKKLIDNVMTEHTKFVKKAKVAERYYQNDNDIKYIKSPSNKGGADTTENPLRSADNRIPFNWQGFLVNQKASYMFTYPPTFDVGDNNINKNCVDVLGDGYPKVCKTLCVNASNSGKAWLHYWIDENNEFQYAVVDTKQVIAVYSNDLKKKLIAVLRIYDSVDEEANTYTVYEYWTDKECYAFRSDKGLTANLNTYNMFTKTNVDNGLSEESSILQHDFEEVPFIEFQNNDLKTSDLDNVKALIDTYDKVFSGFVNDIEDIQEVIFVLTNYGGTDLDVFLNSLKRYKTIDMQNTGPDDKSGLSTITIDIPVEARNKLLEMTEKKIYVQGQGVDPNPEKFGTASGVALKYLYTLLELKAGLMETEFRLAFGKLVRAICKHLNYAPKSIIQTWTRNAIENDSELAEIAIQSKGNISTKTLLKNHPWVENADKEMEYIKEEEHEQEPPMFDEHGGDN